MVNPDAIGSLIHIFFWGWFFEWIIFVIEVCLIMLYFLSWKHMSGEQKIRHIRIGVFLGLFSWLTMAVITGILGFMMHSGSWVPYIRQWVPNSDMFTAASICRKKNSSNCRGRSWDRISPPGGRRRRRPSDRSDRAPRRGTRRRTAPGTAQGSA